MRVLLSTIGTRGEVQPLVALALALRELGHDSRLCAPPDFRAWIERHGLEAVPIGPRLHGEGAVTLPARPSPEHLRRLARETLEAQFATVTEAARGCDALLAGGALQVAARSVTEALGIRYVYASYCPTTLPSPHHPPPSFGLLGDHVGPSPSDCSALWENDARRWNETFGALLDGHRAQIGLARAGDVRSHIFTDRALLAADPTLAPWPGRDDASVVQTGAWILPDADVLSAELEAFLDASPPPVYVGFGSMRVSQRIAIEAIAAARAVGRRVVLARGRAGLSAIEGAADCLTIGDVNQQMLFPRVAVVVHHGGAGTTTAAARAGAPQVIVPQMYDQHYWAGRVERLGIGVAHAAGVPSAASLADALQCALDFSTAKRARSIATTVRHDGARRAAEYVTSRA